MDEIFDMDLEEERSHVLSASSSVKSSAPLRGSSSSVTDEEIPVLESEHEESSSVLHSGAYVKTKMKYFATLNIKPTAPIDAIPRRETVPSPTRSAPSAPIPISIDKP